MGGAGRCKLKQAGMVDVLRAGPVVVPTGGAKVRLHACLSEPVSIKDVSGNIKGIMSFSKELLLCDNRRLL